MKKGGKSKKSNKLESLKAAIEEEESHPEEENAANNQEQQKKPAKKRKGNGYIYQLINIFISKCFDNTLVKISTIYFRKKQRCVR